MEELARVVAKAIRIFGYLLLVTVVLGAVVVIGAIAYAQWRDNRHKSVKVYFLNWPSSEYCDDPEYPFDISFQNTSNSIVDRVSFRIEIRQRGHSTLLTSSVDYTTDRIMQPFEVLGNCWRMPRPAHNVRASDYEGIAENPQNHEVTVVVTGATFR